MNRDLAWLLSTYITPPTFRLHSWININKLTRCMLFSNSATINLIKETLRHECNEKDYLSNNTAAITIIMNDRKNGYKHIDYTWLIRNPDIFTISEEYKHYLDIRLFSICK